MYIYIRIGCFALYIYIYVKYFRLLSAFIYFCPKEKSYEAIHHQQGSIVYVLPVSPTT